MKLSIITINRNNRLGLKQTISSVLNQEFKDYEYIIIDGESADGSRELIKENQNLLSYWISEKDSGVFNAMNKGLTKATGEYVLFLNSGDYLLDKNSLAAVFKNHLAADITICNAKRFNQKGKLEDYTQPDHVDAQFFYRYSLCHQAIIYKRDLFNRFGNYNETRNIVADWEFNLKALIVNKCSYQHFSIPLVYYDNSGQSSTNISLLNAERNEVLNEIFSEAEIAAFEKRHNFNHSIVGKIRNKVATVLSV